MKISPELVVRLRKEKAWSQEELSMASGLNLRTIQRIEREGSISLQSKKSLASALEIELSELDFDEQTQHVKYEYQTVVFKTDVNWISGWGKKEIDTGPYKFDEQINVYAQQGWRVNSITHGTAVHGGAGQTMVLFERRVDGK